MTPFEVISLGDISISLARGHYQFASTRASGPPATVVKLCHMTAQTLGAGTATNTRECATSAKGSRFPRDEPICLGPYVPRSIVAGIPEQHGVPATGNVVPPKIPFRPECQHSEQSVNNSLPNTRYQQDRDPSYRHEEPTRPDTCINLRTRRSHVRVVLGAPTFAHECSRRLPSVASAKEGHTL